MSLYETVKVYTGAERPMFSIFDENIPNDVWTLVSGQIEYIKETSWYNNTDLCGDTYGYNFCRKAYLFEYMIVGSPIIYKVKCEYEADLIGKWHRRIHIESIKFLGTFPDGKTKSWVPTLWSHDRRFSSIYDEGVFTNKDGSLNFVWPDGEYYSNDEGCCCCECDYKKPDNDYGVFFSCGNFNITWECDCVVSPEIIRDRGDDTMFDRVEYEDILEFLDEFQRESDKIDFTFAGNPPVSTIDEIITDMRPEDAVQMILLYCPHSMIDSGK